MWRQGCLSRCRKSFSKLNDRRMITIRRILQTHTFMFPTHLRMLKKNTEISRCTERWFSICSQKDNVVYVFTAWVIHIHTQANMQSNTSFHIWFLFLKLSQPIVLWLNPLTWVLQRSFNHMLLKSCVLIFPLQPVTYICSHVAPIRAPELLSPSV